MNENKTTDTAATSPASTEATMSDVLTVLKDIQANEQREMNYAKKQARTSLIISVLCLILVVGLIGYAIPLINKTSKLVDQVSDLTEDAHISVNDLNQITSDLAAIDIPGLFEEVDELVVNSQKSVDEAMANLNSVDFEGLNQAIADLEAIVSPLAKLLGR